ncbi:hypothetical protein EWM64_g6716 [Hericium alpestre]|uniref:Dicer-like protein 1 n=1 Tax=Hericium alpestre TaxID=135208 RepID=A0A4Y9ZRT7_9AGAM|nr:hypothetical protein EWM64_g6716 [Hericium alpestre]
MLKIWKQAWKKDDTTRPDSRDEGPHLSGTSSGDSSLVSSPMVPPAAGPSSSGSTLSPAQHSGAKRSLPDSSSSLALENAKRPRLELASEDVMLSDQNNGLPGRLHHTPTAEAEDVEADGLPSSHHGCPSELVIRYERPSKLPYPPLYKRLRTVDKEESYLPRHFAAARHALIEVGSCGSDLVWRRAINDLDEGSSPLDDDDDDDESPVEAATRTAKAEMLSIIRHWQFSMPNLDPTSRTFNVTPKFLKLVQILKSTQPQDDSFRCIIFVEKRAVAWVMTDLLRMLDMSYLRPQTLVGNRKLCSLDGQDEIIRAFGEGKYNVIIATKGAEDLDTPKATVVIRYDLFESQISYAYARARACGEESFVIHMLQRGSDVHRRMLTQVTQLDEPMRSWVDSFSHNSDEGVPPSTLHETHDAYLSDSDDEDDPQLYIKDPTTSGRIRLQDATSIIYRFAATLGPASSDPLFTYQITDGRTTEPHYICTVQLPSGPPITKISSPLAPSKARARRVACFAMCQELFSRGLLDYRFFPRPSGLTAKPKQTPDTSGLVEVDDTTWIPSLPPKGSTQDKLNGTRCYPRKSPEFWSNSLSANGNFLYPTIMLVEQAKDSPEPHAPLLLLTRLPLPSLPDFRLFQSSIPMLIRLQRCSAFEVDEERLRDLHRYTIRICRATMNKPFVCPLDRMPYFFAPLSDLSDLAHSNDDRWRSTPVIDRIPWELVKLAANKWVQPLQAETVESLANDLQGAIIQDRWVEYTRSKPADSPREAEYENLVEYCKARRKGFEGLQNYDQPLIQVERVPPILNKLNPTTKPIIPSTKPPAKYLIPELCAKFVIPASTFRTALLLPSITRRIDDLLLVKELNATFFDHSISEDLLHTAVSAPSVGYEFDYERLELLGDAYLKYLSSIYLFVTNPSQHEGALHSARLRIISNRALLLDADAAGLPPFIQAKPFVSKLWQPPNFMVLPPPQVPSKAPEGTNGSMDGSTIDLPRVPSSAEPTVSDISKGTDVAVERPSAAPEAKESASAGEPEGGTASGQQGQQAAVKKSKRKRQLEERDVHWLGDKAVADVAEAIIGAAYITGGRETALKASKALCIAVPRIDRWSDFGRRALAPPPEVTAKLRPGTVEAVERIIGHKFKRPHILAQALTHASIQGYEMTCYERLEFIGDAILDFMVIRHIFHRDTHLSPGALTLLKGAMVSNSALAAVCISSGLHEYLMFESHDLANSIQTYKQKLKAKQAEEYAEAEQEGRAPGQYWMDVEPPKALSDVVESIIGAVYISDNFAPVGSVTLYDCLLKPFYDKHITLKTLSHHPTKTLLELFQRHGCQQFAIVKEQIHGEGQQQITSCDVLVHDVILSSASDKTSALAAKRASLEALDAMEGDSGFMKRTCDCRALNQAKKERKKALAQALSTFSDEEDLMAVEGALVEEANSDWGDEKE